MYRCTLCGITFDNYDVNYRRELMPDGFAETICEHICPICGGFSAYSEEVEECPKCSAIKRVGDILCESCRENLAKRFCDFADYLTAEEEEQLDEWLDGRSVTERARFS